MMTTRRDHPAHRPAPPAATGPGPVLLATVDSLPQPYEVLGLVDAAMAAQSGIVPMAPLMDRLAAEATAMGADGVIGIRLSQLSQPAVSRPGLLGGGVSHHQSTVVAIALGTAVRLLPATPRHGSRTR